MKLISEPDRPKLDGAENQRLYVPDLTAADRSVLAQASPGLLRVEPAAAGGYDLLLGPVCGVLELAGFRVEIRPKLMPDGATVLRWLSYARHVPTGIDLTRGWSTSAAGIHELVVAALLEECTTLLRGGLLRGYRNNEAVDTTLRGRLDVPRQITRRYGQVDRLHLRFFERDTGVWENAVCAAALDVAGYRARSDELRQRARDLRRRFPDTWSTPAEAARKIATSRYHRLNVRYRPAHHWAALLFAEGGPDDVLVNGDWPAGTLLFDMNRLWELVVARLCATDEDSDCVSPGPASVPAITVREHGYSSRTLRPDAVLTTNDRTLPVDAKYKGYTTKPVERNDTHQLLTYASAFQASGECSPAAAIIHPATANAVRTMTVKAHRYVLGRILVVGLDVSSDPASVQHHLRDAARSITSPTIS